MKYKFLSSVAATIILFGLATTIPILGNNVVSINAVENRSIQPNTISPEKKKLLLEETKQYPKYYEILENSSPIQSPEIMHVFESFQYASEVYLYENVEDMQKNSLNGVYYTINFEDKGLIVIDSSIPKEQWLVTINHEYAHHLIRMYQKGIQQWELPIEEEILADLVAVTLMNSGEKPLPLEDIFEDYTFYYMTKSDYIQHMYGNSEVHEYVHTLLRLEYPIGYETFGQGKALTRKEEVDNFYTSTAHALSYLNFLLGGYILYQLTFKNKKYIIEQE